MVMLNHQLHINPIAQNYMHCGSNKQTKANDCGFPLHGSTSGRYGWSFRTTSKTVKCGQRVNRPERVYLCVYFLHLLIKIFQNYDGGG